MEERREMRRLPWLETSVKGEGALLLWLLRGVELRQVGQGQVIFTGSMSAWKACRGRGVEPNGCLLCEIRIGECFQVRLTQVCSPPRRTIRSRPLPTPRASFPAWVSRAKPLPKTLRLTTRLRPFPLPQPNQTSIPLQSFLRRDYPCRSNHREPQTTPLCL